MRVAGVNCWRRARSWIKISSKYRRDASCSQTRGPPLGITAQLLAALGICTTLPAGVRADDAELGRDLYDEFCAACHGRDMVNPGGVTFDLRKFPKDDFERFRNAVLDGKPPAMPPWRDQVGDDDVKLLWAYVRSGG